MWLKCNKSLLKLHLSHQKIVIPFIFNTNTIGIFPFWIWCASKISHQLCIIRTSYMFYSVSPFPAILHQYATASKWDAATKLCRFVKVSHAYTGLSHSCNFEIFSSENRKHKCLSLCSPSPHYLLFFLVHSIKP